MRAPHARRRGQRRPRPPEPTRTSTTPPAARPDDDAPVPLVAVAIAVALFVVLGTIATLDASLGPARLEAAFSAWLQARRTPALDRLMIAATLLGDFRLTTALMIALVTLLAAARRLWLAVHAASVFLSAKLAVAVAKVTLARARPLDLYPGGDTYAFPSGHTTSAAVLLGVVAALTLDRARRGGMTRTGTLAVVTPFALAAALVALSRLYLGAHWPSDVLGALALAAALVVAFDWQLRRAAPLPAFVPRAALALLVGGYLLYALAFFAVEAPRYATVAQEEASSPQSASSLRSRPQAVR